jgi:hypothetical protein
MNCSAEVTRTGRVEAPVAEGGGRCEVHWG